MITNNVIYLHSIWQHILKSQKVESFSQLIFYIFVTDTRVSPHSHGDMFASSDNNTVDQITPVSVFVLLLSARVSACHIIKNIRFKMMIYSIRNHFEHNIWKLCSRNLNIQAWIWIQYICLKHIFHVQDFYISLEDNCKSVLDFCICCINMLSTKI